MQSILHHNSSGKLAFTGNLKNKEVHSAITLHPVKKPQVMYRLHVYMQGLQAQEMRQESLFLHRDISAMTELLHMNRLNRFIAPGVPIFPHNVTSAAAFLGDADILGQSPSLQKRLHSMPVDTVDEKLLLDWNYIAKNIYSAHHANPKHRIESALKEGLEDVIRDIMENINNFSRQRGRIIEFKDILYAYDRVNALHGQDLILDLLLVYKKYRGKKMTVQVRRHLYVQRAFTDVQIREFANIEEDDTVGGRQVSDRDISEILSGHVKKIWSTGFEGWMPRAKKEDKNSGSFTVIRNKTNIVFVLALVGRAGTFRRFLTNFEEVCLSADSGQQKCSLVVALFEGDDFSDNRAAIDRLKVRFPHRNIQCLHMEGNFSRGLALDRASRHDSVALDDILFFIDVDIVFTLETLDRIRLNTIRRRQVYMPIVFSEYDPDARRTLTRGRYRPSHVLSSSSSYEASKEWRIDNENGYFREFGFGICSIFKSDLFKTGIEGFVTDIRGWGLEDVRFLEKIITANREASINNILLSELYITDPAKTRSNNYMLHIFRAPDLSLRHIFHAINCDRGLEEAQYRMCLGTKANTMGSYRFVEDFVLSMNDSVFPFNVK